jgi:GTP-binding protein LepA
MQVPAEMNHGFEEVKPMVFAGYYPVDTDEFEECVTAVKNCN